MFIIILSLILIVIYIMITRSTNSTNSTISNQENFYTCPCKSRKLDKYPYNPLIPTPQTNYNKIISKIDSLQTYKKDLSVALSPTPTIHCPKLVNKNECNKYGCNWFGSKDKKGPNSFCSSTYPTQF